MSKQVRRSSLALLRIANRVLIRACQPVRPAEEDEVHRVPDVSIVESSAELLYGLIHQRYILTRQGLQQMVRALLSSPPPPNGANSEDADLTCLSSSMHYAIPLASRPRPQYAKFEASHFGTCPRVYCTQCKLVPCGRSDLPGVDTVKLFCPSCLDMYVPPSSRFQGVDGASLFLFHESCLSFNLCLFSRSHEQTLTSYIVPPTKPTARSHRRLLRHHLPSHALPNLPVSDQLADAGAGPVGPFEAGTNDADDELEQGVRAPDLWLQGVGTGEERSEDAVDEDEGALLLFFSFSLSLPRVGVKARLKQ